MSGAGEPEIIDPREVEVVFLDAGGVLLNPDWRRVSGILARYGIRATSGQLVQAEQVAKRQMDEHGVRHATQDITHADGYLGWVVRATGIAHDHEALHRAAGDFDAEHARDNLWSEMPADVPGALERLRATGYRLAVISNAEPNLRDRIAAAGISPFFESIVISAEVGAEKPDRAIFEEALDRMAVAPGRAIHVGDFYSVDVVGARGVGITPILLDARGLSADRDVTRVRSLSQVARLLSA